MLNDHNFKSLIAIGDQKKFRQLKELTSDELLWFTIGFVENKEIDEMNKAPQLQQNPGYN